MDDPLSAATSAPALVITNIAPRNRLTTLVRLIITIPWLIVGALWGIAALLCAVVAWFVLLFTGRYPPALYEFVAGYVRFYVRVHSFGCLLVDPFPPFDGAEHPEYPAALQLGPPPASYSRLKVLLRIFYVIPAYIVAYIAGIVTDIVGIISWLVILVTGKEPDGLQNALRWALGWQTRLLLLITLLTETYDLQVA
jgi:hypothetical protein